MTATSADPSLATERPDDTPPSFEQNTLSSSAWTTLAESGDDTTFLTGWLNILGAAVGGIVLARIDLDGRSVFCWPENASTQRASDLATLASLADVAMRQRKPMLRAASGERRLLACPIIIEATACGSCVIEVSARSSDRLRDAMSALFWGCAWLRDRVRQRRAEKASAKAEQDALVLDILATALDQSGFVKAAIAAATELATKLECDRIAIGFVKGGSVEIVALSHSSSVNRRTSLVQRIESAMSEAIEQHASLIFPPGADDAAYLLQAHAALSREIGEASVLTVPLFLHDTFVGAILAERSARRPFDQQTLDLLAACSAALAPILFEKSLNDRVLPRKIAAALQTQFKRLFGPSHFGRKLAAIGLVLAALAVYGVRTTYHVDAEARVEGRIERALVAPFDGFIRTASLRAGDVAREGDVLAELDDRDLWLERSSAIAERQQRRLEYDRALSAGDRAAANIALAQIAKAEAQITLLDGKLARAKVTAPFAGVIIEGDFSRAIGGPVHNGDTLFRIAPLDDYRVALSVDESQLTDIAPGDTGQLLTTSLPDRPFPIRIQKITPVAEAKDGRTVFRVEATVDGVEGLRPGMEGVAKIDAGRRRLAWIWTRTLSDWLVLHLWAWWP